jgi:arylsulfatase A-like enzyme
LDKNGTYSPIDLADVASEMVRDHTMQHPGAPLFMYFALASVHSPYEVPDYYRDLFSDSIADPDRRTYAGMVAAMDEAVGNVTAAFIDSGLWEDTLMVLCSDNGGTGPGRNWPLRGRKFGLWEGGIRSASFVRGWGVTPHTWQSNAMIHAVDWYATLIRVGSNSSYAAKVSAATDSIDVWDVLSGDSWASPRTQFVINIEPFGSTSNTVSTGGVRFGRFKYLENASGGTCDECPEGADCDTSCTPITPCLPANNMDPTGPILIDLWTDPAENYNLFWTPGYQEVAMQAQDILNSYVKTMVPALYNVCKDEMAADPAKTDFIWATGWCEPPYVANSACGL